jgi:protein SCO1/2
LFLVNQDGIIVKYYSALDVPYEELLSDIQILLKQSD